MQHDNQTLLTPATNNYNDTVAQRNRAGAAVNVSHAADMSSNIRDKVVLRAITTLICRKFLGLPSPETRKTASASLMSYHAENHMGQSSSDVAVFEHSM